ncbi:MAG: hypothetical protein RR489_07330 [Clostridia bacterium]
MQAEYIQENLNKYTKEEFRDIEKDILIYLDDKGRNLEAMLKRFNLTVHSIASEPYVQVERRNRKGTLEGVISIPNRFNYADSGAYIFTVNEEQFSARIYICNIHRPYIDSIMQTSSVDVLQRSICHELTHILSMNYFYDATGNEQYTVGMFTSLADRYLKRTNDMSLRILNEALTQLVTMSIYEGIYADNYLVMQSSNMNLYIMPYYFETQYLALLFKKAGIQDDEILNMYLDGDRKSIDSFLKKVVKNPIEKLIVASKLSTLYAKSANIRDTIALKSSPYLLEKNERLLLEYYGGMCEEAIDLKDVDNEILNSFAMEYFKEYIWS